MNKIRLPRKRKKLMINSTSRLDYISQLSIAREIVERSIANGETVLKAYRSFWNLTKKFNPNLIRMYW